MTEAAITLWLSLRFPRATLRRVEDRRHDHQPLPYATWGALTGIAVAGSAVYGASLSLVLPRWRPTGGALWLALSAGAGWCVFGPTLVVVTRRDPFALAHACLVTMAYGEGVLVGGAMLNALLARAPEPQPIDATAFNLGWVGLSNVVMASALALQLRVLGVPARTSLLLWMGALNGSGAVFFRVLRGLLQDGPAA